MRKLLRALAIVILLAFTGCGSEDMEKGQSKQEEAPATTAAQTVEETTTQKTMPKKTEKTSVEKTSSRTPEKTAPASPPAAPTPPSPPPEQEEVAASEYDATATVMRVVDGDTVEISPAIDGIEDVRLIGVDTPETRECPGGQPLSQEAKAYTTSELQGQEIGLEFDVEQEDRYNRLLAYVYRNGEMFNEDLLEEGYAQVATFSPNMRYVERFLAAQEGARSTGLGIWALPPEQLGQLADRGNGIGGASCASSAPPPKTKTPTPMPQPVPQPVPATPQGGDVDCSDFGSSAEAQAFLLPGDPNKLDADGDGQACDSLG